jgi:hypothetical protein
MTETTTTEPILVWHQPSEAPFQLCGFPWFAAEGVYRRLPKAPEPALPEAVDGLANHTAGGQIRFRTDATTLAIRVTLLGISTMPHMALTGQSGFDCYLGNPPRYYRTSAFASTDKDYFTQFYSLPAAEMRSVVLNFPLYQGVESVEVAVNEGAQLLSPAPFADLRPIVFYGTSITHGGCACRPGMAYPNLLSRWMNREMINLGFSGSGRGEPALAHCLAAIPDPACYVLDYEANSSLEGLKETLVPFIGILRAAHPTVPILVLSRIRFSYELVHADSLRNREDCKAFQQETVTALRAQGDTNLHFYDGSTLLGEDWEECTVDGVHPTDLGFWRMAHGLLPVLGQLVP